MKTTLYILSVFLCVIAISCNHRAPKKHNEQRIVPNSQRETPKFVASVVRKPSDINELYDELGFKYYNLDEAEIKIKAIIDSTDSYYHFYDEFITLLKNDPGTLDYEFKKLQDAENVSIVTSDDGNIRFYFWETGMGGRQGSWYNLCQYRSDGKVYVFEGSIQELKYYNTEYIKKNPEWDYLLDCIISNIYTLHANNGETYYLVCTERNTIGDIYMGVEPISIENGVLKCDAFFKSDTIFDYWDVEKADSLYRNFNVRFTTYSNGFFNDSDNWDRLYSFDRKTKTLYIPELEDYDKFTDQYALYQFNGKSLEYVGKDGGYWLHPSIRQFESLEAMFFTKDYRIRIDRISDGRYRYVSWKRTASVSDEPDIVIFGTYYNEAEEKYIFNNNGYVYIVEYDHSNVDHKKGVISIFHNEKRILFQEEDIYY